MHHDLNSILLLLKDRECDYNYSLLEFNGLCKKVKIICNQHGIFK